MSMSRFSASGILFFYGFSFLYEKIRRYHLFHGSNNLRSHDGTDCLSFSDSNIEKIFLKRKFTIFYLELSDIIPLRGILVQDPHIVNTKERNQSNQYNIDLSEGKSKILACRLSFREKRNMSFFRYEDIRIHIPNLSRNDDL